MENSLIQVVRDFESNYELYHESYNKLISSDWREMQSSYKSFVDSVSLVIEIFFNLLDKLNLDYSLVIKSEINSLIREEFSSKIKFSNKFIELYNRDPSKYYFVMFLVLEEKIEQDITEELIDLSAYVFKKDDWYNRIECLVEGLAIYGNPIGLVVIDKLLEKLKKEKNKYNQEIGNQVLVYLFGIPTKYLIPFLDKYTDYPLEPIREHFIYIKKKVLENT